MPNEFNDDDDEGEDQQGHQRRAKSHYKAAHMMKNDSTNNFDNYLDESFQKKPPQKHRIKSLNLKQRLDMEHIESISEDNTM